MGKKHQISPVSVLAGGAALTAIGVVLAPVMLKTGLRTIRKYASQFVFDPETGQIRRKDENVVVLNEEDYTIEKQ
ncbi:MAG: hypothetical protein II916_02455 [Oscillospiraceae bacterium]|nr:hypothetical protein [Oscillospiraceae bacterium]